MSASALNIAVIGNGIAGAAATLFLRRAGHDVTTFEQSEADAPAGAGLLLQPPALAVLRAANFDQEICALGEPVNHISAVFAASNRAVRLDYPQGVGTTPACGIQREALIRVLRQAAGSGTRWSTGIARVDPETGIVTTTAGDAVGSFDLIVAADGARSTARASCPELVRVDRGSSSAAIVCVLDSEDPAFRRGVMQRFHGQAHVSTWPIGIAKTGDASRLNIAMSVNAAALSGAGVSADQWLARIKDIHPPLWDLVREQTTPPKLLPYTFRDVETHRYVEKRIVLIGDAAHAMSPQLGLGASMALLDAWSLASSLGEHGSVAGALAAFDATRRPDVKGLQQISRWVTPLFQSDSRIVAALREQSVLAIGHSDALKRHAMATLCKIPRGLAVAT